MTHSPYNPPGARVDDIVKRRSVAEIEGFINLLRAACADAGVNAALERLLAMPDAERRAFVSAWVADLLARGAPRPFVEAIACLHDDAVAEKTQEVIHTCLD